MKTPILATLFAVFLASSLYGQSGNINNTLGDGGSFVIKDGSTTFLSLDQTNGLLSLARNLDLPNTTQESSGGVIYKGTVPFIHDFRASNTLGLNTFVGLSAGNFLMSGTSGPPSDFASYNTGVGYSSLTSLETGSHNSAFGARALLNVTEGYRNSAFGFNAGLGIYVGSANTIVGFGAGTNTIGGSNNTVIGNGAQVSSSAASNEITLGNSSITSLRCQVTSITALSDLRDKKNIQDLPHGLDFLLKVKPRLFHWDMREWYDKGTADGSRMRESPTAGFIAQELDEAQTAANAEWLNLVLKTNPDRLEATPGNLLPVIVKAIQELKIENDQLRKEISDLRLAMERRSRDELEANLHE